MSIFAAEMAKQYTDTDEVLRMINLRLRKLEKSDSEKTEEIGRLNRIIGQKDKEIHSLKMNLASTRSELADAKAHIEELEENGWWACLVFPMASNIQLVFYRTDRSDRDVLVKVLLNEQEVTLPFASELAPYYHWSDFRNYYLGKLYHYDMQRNGQMQQEK